MTHIVKILFLAADPDDQARMRLGDEIREIEKKIGLGKYRDHFRIATHFAVREDDIRPALLTHQPHILHFSGHGSDKEGIVLQDAYGNAQHLSPQRLARIIATIPDNLRIVFLNACFTAYHAAPISETVDFTIGMNNKVLDKSAIDFSANFYLGLGFNRNIQRCFDLGVTALVGQDTPQEHIPVLLSRNGVDASQTRLLCTDDQPCVDAQSKSTDATVHLDIVVMPHKVSNIKVWRYATDQDRQTFIALDKTENRLTPTETWEQLAKCTSQTATILSAHRRDAITDVFVLLRGNFVENLHDERTLEEIIKHVSDNSQGANLYIGWDHKTAFQVAYPRFQTVIERWFRLILASGATDLIELPANLKLDRSEDYTVLRRFAQKSETRRGRLRRLVSDQEWRIVLRPKALAVKKFLEQFDEGELVFDEASNLAVFYDQRPRQGWIELLKDSQRFERGGNWFIATLARGKVKDNDLAELWLRESEQFGAGSFDGIFEFEGTFEWLYALLRLKLAVRLSQENSSRVAGKILF